MAGKTITLTVKIWRQAGPDAKGQLETFPGVEVPTDMSFLEMIDEINNALEKDNKEPIAMDHDCREGICGMCGMVVNGIAHGHQRLTTICQLHMRQFKDGDTLTIEPFRAKGFPIIKDLVVDRSAFDRIIRAGGYISVATGQAPDANATLIPKDCVDIAMDSASCIGCGACVAACPNASASLFTAAKITQLAILPQGHPERTKRVVAMVQQMDDEDFGSCSKHYECELACPKGIKVTNITTMNREYLRALVKEY